MVRVHGATPTPRPRPTPTPTNGPSPRPHDPQVVSFSSASEAQHDGTTTPLALAEQAQATWPQHFVYDFEAYDHGRFVQSMHWETDAVSQQHLLQLMANAQAGFTQRLNDARIPWNAVYPIFRSSRPLPR